MSAFSFNNGTKNKNNGMHILQFDTYLFNYYSIAKKPKGLVAYEVP